MSDHPEIHPNMLYWWDQFPEENAWMTVRGFEPENTSCVWVKRIAQADRLGTIKIENHEHEWILTCEFRYQHLIDGTQRSIAARMPGPRDFVFAHVVSKSYKTFDCMLRFIEFRDDETWESVSART